MMEINGGFPFSRAEELMNYLLSEARYKADVERQNEFTHRLDIYKNDYDDLLTLELRKNFSNDSYERFNFMRDTTFNLSKRVIDEVSIVYKEEATRKVLVNGEENEDLQEVYDDIIDRTNANLLLPQINRYTNVFNSVGVLVHANSDTQDIQLVCLTPDRMSVYQDPHNPTEVIALVYRIDTPVTVGSTKQSYVYWDVFGNHVVFDEDKRVVHNPNNVDNVNPYLDPERPGRTLIPIVWSHKNLPDIEWWDCTTGSDLFTGTLHINVLMTYLNHMFKMTGFKQKYAIGDVRIPANKIQDPATLIQIVSSGAEQPELGTFDNTFPLQEYWNVLQSKISVVANSYGISESNFKISLSARSGFALLLENWGKVEQVQKQVPLLRKFEMDLFNTIKVISNSSDFLDDIPEDSSVSVDFAEIEFKEDPLLENQKWMERINMGVASPVDWIMSINPDISREEAEEMYRRNLGEKKQLNQRFGGTFGRTFNGQNDSQTPGQSGQDRGQDSGN